MHEADNPNRSPDLASSAPSPDDARMTHGQREQEKEHLPPLNVDRAFWGMTATQFLGAFNDNVYKQLVLLLAVTATSSSGESYDLQGPGMVVFALPFLLFSGIAGYYSERNNKRTVIVLCKVAEIVVMAAGVLAFFFYPVTGFAGLLAVLFLMGTQSAFFGPGKYGILPELFRQRDLPQTNGVILMTTFLAIIFGSAFAGLLMEHFVARIWIAGMACVVIAVAGTGTSLMVRRTPPAKADLRLTLSAFVVPGDVWRGMRADHALLWALLASCMFWLVGAVVQMSINALGIKQLGVGELRTSLLVTGVGVGIAVGAMLAGRLSRGQVNFTIMRIGAWGIVGTLLLVAVFNPPSELLSQDFSWLSGPRGMWLRYGATMAALVAAGGSTGLFAVPLQVFLQSRAPHDQKGRVIATMNLANWIAIIVGGVLYSACSPLLEWLSWPASTMFVITAMLMAPVAALYRPRNESLP
ncbi:MAG: MFS transporter [Pirellulaceae bacterium]